MKYQYLGPQTVAELADGKRVLLCKGSVLLVLILSAQLKALVERKSHETRARRKAGFPERIARCAAESEIVAPG